MKIKDLQGEGIARDLKIKTPTGEVGYIISFWPKGAWLADTYTGTFRTFPYFFDDVSEMQEWEITDEPPNMEQKNIGVQIKI